MPVRFVAQFIKPMALRGIIHLHVEPDYASRDRVGSCAHRSGGDQSLSVQAAANQFAPCGQRSLVYPSRFVGTRLPICAAHLNVRMRLRRNRKCSSLAARSRTVMQIRAEFLTQLEIGDSCTVFLWVIIQVSRKAEKAHCAPHGAVRIISICQKQFALQLFSWAFVSL